MQRGYMDRFPADPHAFEKHKLGLEARERSVDRINAYQTDTRQRVDTLVKSIFLLSGGALTISISIFLRDGAPAVPSHLMDLLSWAWLLLFWSLAGATLILFMMIVQGYLLGELWKEQSSTGVERISSHKGLLATRWFNWIVGVSAVLSFLVGLAFVARVSIGVISVVH